MLKKFQKIKIKIEEHKLQGANYWWALKTWFILHSNIMFLATGSCFDSDMKHVLVTIGLHTYNFINCILKKYWIAICHIISIVCYFSKTKTRIKIHTTILLKLALNTNQSINQSINQLIKIFILELVAKFVHR